MNAIKGVIGFTAGNFDLLHPGYLFLLQLYKALQHRIVV